MKYSKQREIIYNFVKNNPLHLTADSIYEMLKKDQPNLSLGTVYRNLSQLAQHNLIKKISIPNQPDRFDGTLANHFHFLCLKCHKVQDLFIDEIATIEQLVENQANVAVQKLEISFKGLCTTCKDDPKQTLR